MGHFNIQFYAAKVADGLSASMAEIGLPDSAGISLQYKVVFSHYQGEFHVNDELEIRAAVLAVGDDDIRLLTEIINSGTGNCLPASICIVRHVTRIQEDLQLGPTA